MTNAKALGWVIAVVGLVQLIMTYMGGGSAVEYILALIVLVLGAWSAMGK